MELTQEPSRWAISLYNFAVQLQYRYFHTKALNDIKEAICASRSAVKGSSKGNLDLAKRLHGLGKELHTKYLHMKAPTDVEEAAQCFETACIDDQSRFSHKLLSVINCIKLGCMAAG